MSPSRFACAVAVCAACSSTETRPEDVGVHSLPSVTTPQIQLDGSTIPQFVLPLTTLSETRVDGTQALHVDMVELQQKVLPPQLYPASGPFAAGTLLWGYAISAGSGGRVYGPRWPAFTIEARRNTPTTVTYTNGLVGANGTPPALQQLLTVDMTLHWADPIGTSRDQGCVQGDENGGASILDAGLLGGNQGAVPPGCAIPYVGPVPAVPHLHGGEVPSVYDGHPEAWFTPGERITGPAFTGATYQYPNRQEATELWFHDHALGVTRLNVYAGLAGIYLIRDDRDTGSPTNPITLPGGAFEQEIAIADRIFDSNGQLLFPDGSGLRQGFDGPPANPNLHPFAIPELFGDVMTVNGASWPFFAVEPRRYRLRILNASNARFLQMQLFAEATTGGVFNGIATLFTDPAGVGVPGPHLWQIGSDGGLLDAPVDVDLVTPGVPAMGDPRSPHLLMAPGERSDVVVDFGGQAGKRFILTNTAVAPYPGGGATVESLPPPAQQGPTPASPSAPGPYEVTQQIMEIRVDLPLVGADTSFDPAGAHPALRATPLVNIKGATPDVRRQLVMDEVEDSTTGAPVEVMLENAHFDGLREGSSTVLPGSVSSDHGQRATEAPRQGATELWEIANMTPDAHPIHLHLVEFQVVDTQPFNTQSDLCGLPGPQYRVAWNALFPGGTFNGFSFAPGTFIPGYGPPLDYATPNADGAVGGNLAFGAGNDQFFAGPAVPPAPRDQGWKDTFRMFPCAVTRVAVRWAPQDRAAGSTQAGTDYFAFDPTVGPGYIWHCHILDHEDDEMMRPLIVTR